MITEDFGPIVGEVDVGLGTQPGQRSGVADERTGEVVDGEGDLAAAGDDVVGAVGTVAGDTESSGVVGAVVGLLGGVAQVGDAEADLREELG